MTIYLAVFLFIIGINLGSFYNVVGYRLPRGESIVFPSSHCPKCGHKLKFMELIPVLSYFILKGKCHNCHEKISLFYPLFEFMTGLLFAVTYLVFGLNMDMFIALVFISMLLIIVISDYQTLTIPDEVLAIGGIILCILIYIRSGVDGLYIALLNGVIAFIIMYLVKMLGDFIFKKESMGGGDIKLLFIFGLVLGYDMAVLSIFVGSVIGLPISIMIVKKNKSNIIPFGPFLSIGATVVLLSKMSLEIIVNFLR